MSTKENTFSDRIKPIIGKRTDKISVKLLAITDKLDNKTYSTHEFVNMLTFLKSVRDNTRGAITAIIVSMIISDLYALNRSAGEKEVFCIVG